MKKTHFSDKNEKELKEAIAEGRKALVNLRIEKEQRKTKNVHSIRDKKKELARMLTALKAKETTK